VVTDDPPVTDRPPVDEPSVTDPPVADARPDPSREAFETGPEPPREQFNSSPDPQRGPTADARSDAGSADFEALFHREFTTMFRLAHLLGSDDPEDVVQEAFVRLHARWDRLRDRTAAGGYLRTTVVNVVRSRAEHRAVVRRRTPPAERTEAASAEAAALDGLGDATMLAALRDLSPRQREALVLRFWLVLSERKIADAMGTSTGTAKSHVSRGLSALRAALDRPGGL
jgi:RNA polymerase sigma-70 factor (sigma-E family)